jgi:O-antigen/teichoic acid export membrane protein
MESSQERDSDQSIPRSDVERTISGGTLFITSHIVQIGTQALIIILISIWLTTLDFGAYAILYSLAFILTRIAELGIGQGVVTLISKLKENEKQIVGDALAIKALLGVGSFGIFILISYFWFGTIFERFLAGIIIGFSYIIIEQISILLYYVFRAHDKIKYEAATRIINSILGVTVLVLLNWIFTPSLIINSIAIALIPVYNVVLRSAFYKKMKGSFVIDLKQHFLTRAKNTLKISYMFGIWAVLVLGFNQGILLLLGLLGGEIAAANYRVAYSMAGIIALTGPALWAVLFPALSRYAANKQYSDFQKLLQIILKVAIFLTAFLITSYWIVIDDLVAFIFGTKYIGADFVARILLVAFFIEGILTSFEIALASLNRQKINTYILFSSVLTSFVLTYLFNIMIFADSNVAAALAIVIAQFLRVIFLMIVSRRVNNSAQTIDIKWGLIGLLYMSSIIPAEILRILDISPVIKLILWLPLIAGISIAFRILSLKEIRWVLGYIRGRVPLMKHH